MTHDHGAHGTSTGRATSTGTTTTTSTPQA